MKNHRFTFFFFRSPGHNNLEAGLVGVVSDSGETQLIVESHSLVVSQK